MASARTPPAAARVEIKTRLVGPANFTGLSRGAGPINTRERVERYGQKVRSLSTVGTALRVPLSWLTDLTAYRGPPPPIATGKASLLHYFSSSPSVRTDASTPTSSSPAPAGPSRANSAPQAAVDNTADSTDKIASSSNQQTPRAPLRPTQSLGSLESTSVATAARVFGGAPVASTSRVKLAASPSRLVAPASTSSARRSPRKKLTPTTEASEDEYEPTERVRAESVTPRRNPPRAAAQASSPILPPLSPSRPVPRSPRAPLGDKSKGKERSVDAPDSDVELVRIKVESSPKGKDGRVLSLLSPSPTKRPRRRPKKIFSFTTDEQGRTVLDLTTSSPSVSSASAFSDDSDDEVIVVGVKRSSVRPSTTPQQKINIKQEMLDASMSPTKAPRTPRRSLTIVAGSEQDDVQRDLARADSEAVRVAGESNATHLAPRTTPTRPSPKAATGAADQAHGTPLDSQGSATYTPSVSITLASDSPRTSGQIAAQPQPGPLTPTRASAQSASDSAIRGRAATDSSAQMFYDAPCTTPRAKPSTNEFQTPSSGNGTNGQPVTHSAIRRLTPTGKTPSHPESSDSRYIRSPSGSPLSSLAPTPRRPTSRNNAVGTGSPSRPAASTGKRTHTFELVVDLPRSGASSKKAKLAGKTNQKRPPATAPGKQPPKRNTERSEWDAYMDGDTASGQSADDESEREGSPSPAKRRRTRPASPRPVAVTPREPSSESSGSDSEFEELQSFLGRARTRREAGETLLPVGATSPSVATAATTVSPPTDGAEEGVRRSHRARQETDHYVPGAGQRAKAKPAPAAKTAPGLFGGKNAAPSSSDGFDKLMRERNIKERKGHTVEWYAKWENELRRDDSESEVSWV